METALLRTAELFSLIAVTIYMRCINSSLSTRVLFHTRRSKYCLRYLVVEFTETNVCVWNNSVCGGNLSYIRRRRRRPLYVGEAYKRRRICGLRGKHTSDDVSAGYGGSIQATTYLRVTGEAYKPRRICGLRGEAYKPRRVCGLLGKHSSDDVSVGYFAAEGRLQIRKSHFVLYVISSVLVRKPNCVNYGLNAISSAPALE